MDLAFGEKLHGRAENSKPTFSNGKLSQMEISDLDFGDYFIQRLEFGNTIVFGYCCLKGIKDSKLIFDFQSRNPPLVGVELSQASHRLLGRISQEAYMLARLRGWPNSDASAQEILDFSDGQDVTVSFIERIRIKLALWLG